MSASADTLELQIGQWRGYVRRQRAISQSDVAELEDHLREEIHELQEAGLHDDEAFLVAVKRLGGLSDVSAEFALEHSERLWKQLVLTEAGPTSRAGSRELVVAIGLAVGAAVAIKVPALLGLSIDDDPAFYARNLSLFVLPFLAAYFAFKRQLGWGRGFALLAPPFLVGAIAVNVYPFASEGSTLVLAAIHLPVALWFAVGLGYVGGQWRSHPRRMDFIRFTGEWVVYYTLLAIGGGVLMGLTVAGFDAIGVDAETAVAEWIMPCGAMGAVIIAAWLVEAKQGVVENIAPVLTAVFTPLTTLMLMVYLVGILSVGDILDVDRDLLILADLILVLVLGLLLYSLSARDPQAGPGLFDRLSLLLVVVALLIDLLMLAAMVVRIAEFGASPNKVAALGLNLLLLVNLMWSARLSVGFLRGGRFAAMERWQTWYLPLFGLWAAVVVLAFPPLFGWI